MTNAEARFNKIHIRKVYACLAVTCHLHFWQNDRDFLRATVVTRGWNGYRNKSQHRKSGHHHHHHHHHPFPKGAGIAQWLEHRTRD